ncbi:MAG: HDOD domain-containing protein [Epsilonproteobacteria bacterium]|nr:HDOD domain-containing protein [Campylobacterota bacterium]
MINTIVQKIKALPPLPSSFQKINKIANDPNGTIAELVKVVEQDPMLTANLLKIANSPLYGFQREIKNIFQAVSLFGMSLTRTLAANISVKNILKTDMEPYGLTPEEFAEISNIQSLLAKRWYSKIDDSKTDILCLTALLQESGKLIIAKEISERGETASFKEEIQNAQDLSEVEKHYINASSAEVTAAIFEHWNFNDIVINSIKYSDYYEAAPKDVKDLSFALKVIKTAVPVNAPLQEKSVKRAIELLEKENMDKNLFLKEIDFFLETVK